MGFCVTRLARHAAVPALALLSIGLAACGSSTPTGPSSLSANATTAGEVNASVTSSASAAGGVQIAAADTIKITQGTLVVDARRPGSISLKGSHGFRFEGRTLSGVDPSQACGAFTPCQPGQTVGFTATWAGLDLPGTVRVQGDEFTIGGMNTPGMRIDLTGSFVAPPQADTAVVTVPFTVSGVLPGFELTGSGQVTFTLQWQPFVNGWAITSSSFEF